MAFKRILMGMTMKRRKKWSKPCKITIGFGRKVHDACGRHSAVYSTQVFALYFGQHLGVSQRVFGCNVCWMCCFAPVFCCVFLPFRICCWRILLILYVLLTVFFVYKFCLLID
eukprot:21326_1